MFVLTPVGVLLLVVIIYLLEIALFWGATALGDGPPLSWGKMVAVSLTATFACMTVGGTIAWSLRSVALLAPDNRLLAAMIALLGLLVAWVVPGVLYAPLAPVSVPRGMLISGVQALLRLFLYVLIAAVFMVVLAVVQILWGTDPHGMGPAPHLAHALFFTTP